LNAYTIACCLVVGLGLGLGLDLMSGWSWLVGYLFFSSVIIDNSTQRGDRSSGPVRNG